jgi:hypothetical protein
VIRRALKAHSQFAGFVGRLRRSKLRLSDEADYCRDVACNASLLDFPGSVPELQMAALGVFPTPLQLTSSFRESYILRNKAKATGWGDFNEL